MIYLNIFLYLMTMTTSNLMLFDFDSNTKTNSWQIVDDGVMGGMSAGNFSIDSEGNGVFEGRVSLENNGGFSSLRHGFETKSIQNYSKMLIRLKGDGKQYQVRVKSKQSDYYSYITYIDTSKDWQVIEITLSEMYPTFRGQKLRMSNYSGEKMEEIAFLIGNKKPESFKLLIDKIELK